eukprot:366104-Chlamydomonas_euryale.AAC.16
MWSRSTAAWPADRVARYVRIWGLRRNVRTNTQHVAYTTRTVRAGEALRLPPVVFRVMQYRICPTWCGFHTMDRAPTQQVCATAYERSRVGLFGHEAAHVQRRLPKADEKDQQVEEGEGEELPDQEKQPVLKEGAAAGAKAAATAEVTDIDTNFEDF